jgi:alpha-glucuronidase
MNKKKFNCDLNGGIMVTSALRYVLGRHTCVPESIQQWITDNWGDLDFNTKSVIVRDILDYLYEDYFYGVRNYENKTWEIFAVDRLSNVSYAMQSAIKEEMTNYSKNKAKWYNNIILNYLKRLEALQELTQLDQELGLQ